MKKIYTLLYLLINALPLSCMQEQSSNATELVTVYRPAFSTNTTKKTSEQTEKQLLFKSILSNESNCMLVNKLYKDAWDVFKTSEVSQVKKLINLIIAMDNAKNNNINTDIMGKFSYDQWEKYLAGLKMVFFFGYLKHYTITANITKETLPNIEDITKKVFVKHTPNQLAIILGLQVPSNTTTPTVYEEYDTNSASSKFPAFHTLKVSLSPHYSIDEDWINYIYSCPSIEKNEYLKLSYEDLKNRFYDGVPYVSNNLDKQDYLYCLLQIIDAGKTLTPAKYESDFEYDFISSAQTLFAQGLAFVNMDPTVATRHRAALFCRAIKQYNDQRKNKTTPTAQQFAAYNKKPECFTCPDITTSTLFNKKTYAFKELKQLIANLKVLFSIEEKYRKECIDSMYPQKNNPHNTSINPFTATPMQINAAASNEYSTIIISLAKGL